MSNDSYTKVDNTSLDPGSILSSLNKAQQANQAFKWISGTAAPRAAGNYALVDANGDTIVLSPRAWVSRSFIVGTTDLAGGTNVDVGGAASNGGAVVTSVTGGVVLTAALVAGVTETAAATALGATNFYLSLTSTGVFTAGAVEVILEVMEM